MLRAATRSATSSPTSDPPSRAVSASRPAPTSTRSGRFLRCSSRFMVRPRHRRHGNRHPNRRDLGRGADARSSRPPRSARPRPRRHRACRRHREDSNAGSRRPIDDRAGRRRRSLGAWLGLFPECAVVVAYAPDCRDSRGVCLGGIVTRTSLYRIAVLVVASVRGAAHGRCADRRNPGVRRRPRRAWRLQPHGPHQFHSRRSDDAGGSRRATSPTSR